MDETPNQKELLFQGIANASRSLVYATDLDGRFIFSNRELEELLGVPEGGLLGKTREAFLPAEVCEQHRAHDLAVIESGETLTVEETNEEADGLHTYLSVKSPLRDEEGRLFAIASISTDITERKRATELVEQSEALHRELFDRAPIAYQSLDADGRFITVNQAWTDVFGYSPDEITGRWFGDLLVPEQASAFRERFAVFKASGTTRDELEMVAKDGQHKWVALEGCIGFDVHGSFKQTNCVLQDITQQRRTEEALRASEERFRSLVEQASDGIFVADETGHYVDANVAGCEMTGYVRDEVVGMAIADIMSPDDLATTPLRMADLRSGATIKTERLFIRKDRSTFVGEVSVRMLEDGRFLSIIRDVTERKQVQVELEASQRRFSTLFNTTPDAVHVNRLSDGLYLEINDGFTALTGYTREDVRGRTSLELGVWADSSERTRLVEKLRRDGEVSALETRFRRKDGSIIPVLVSSRVVELEGEACIFSVSTDISALKHAEDRVKKLNRVYTVLSRVNQALVHLRDPQKIFEETCRVMVEDGGFRMAWIGLVAADGTHVEPVSSAGASEEYLDTLDIVLRGEARTNGPVSSAISERAHVVLHDIEQEAATSPWRSRMLREGYRSMAAFPLIVRERVVGALAIYSEEPGFFDEQQIALLDELSQDVAFSLDLFEREELRKQAEEALVESEHWLTESQRRAHLGHYVYDIRKDWWEGSPALYEVLGVDEEYKRDFPGWLGTVHPLDRESMSRYFTEDVLGKRLPFDREYRVLRPSDGAERWVRGKGAVDRSEDGRPMTMFGIIQDITDFKLAEQRHESILQAATDGFWIVDMTGRLVEVNDAYCQMSGYSQQELLAMNISDVEDLETPEQAAANIEYTRTHGRHRFESRHRRKDGSAFDVEISVHYHPENGGHLATFVHDISGRKQREKYGQLARDILVKLNEPGTEHDSIRRVVTTLRAQTGVDAVGVRLQEGEDYPYFATEGFADGHLLTENTLIHRDETGEVRRGEDGSVQLECTCGLVVSGGGGPLLTPGGSFWTNDTSPSRALAPDEDSRLCPRHVCIIEGFASMALVPIRDKGRIIGLIHLVDRRTGRFDLDSIQLLEGIAAHIGEAMTRKHTEERLARSLASVTEIVSLVSEIRDPYTAGHQRRVSQLVAALATQMGWPDEQIEEIRIAALLHDVGKMSVPAEILSKPGMLSPVEFQLITGHAEVGCKIITAANMEARIAEMVYQHHERCDGSGYPRGMTADELLPGAKMIAVADVVEAMVSHRPYRPGLGVEAALAEIEAGAGVRFDADVVRACVDLFSAGGFTFSEE
jgi:PAS domain S-box-containing protein/putative nucleotidyltransferase with HDIG domain